VLPERRTAGETGAQADGQPARCDVGDGADGGRLGDHMPKARDEHRCAQLDPVGVLGNQCQASPDVLPERRGVGKPDTIIAQRFGQQRVLDSLGSRGQQTRKPQGHGVPPVYVSSRST